MPRVNRLQGCYRRLLIFATIAVVVIGAAAGFIYQRVGGLDGARYWMAGRALDSVEAHLLTKTPNGGWVRKPDGISADGVKLQFQRVRIANANRRVELTGLDEVLRDYQTKFHRTKPATQEAIDFQSRLESVILPEAPHDAGLE